MSQDRRTIRTDVRDLKQFEHKMRGVRDWGHADVESPTLFIVEGYEGAAGAERIQIKVAANFFDALAARGTFGPGAWGIYLFAQRPGTHSRETVFGRIEEVVGSSRTSDMFITLHGGESFLVEAPGQRYGSGKVANARCLYSTKTSD